MDWIEQWLGFAPDGGDGTLEAAIVIVVAVLVIAAITAVTPAGRRLVGKIRDSFEARKTQRGRQA
jgi:hypothetical protein